MNIWTQNANTINNIGKKTIAKKNIVEDTPFTWEEVTSTPKSKKVSWVSKINDSLKQELVDGKKAIAKRVRKKSVSSKTANVSFWDKFIKNVNAAVDFSKVKYEDIKTSVTGALSGKVWSSLTKAVKYTAKGSWKTVKAVWSIAKKNPVKTWIAAYALYSFIGHSGLADLNNHNYSKPTITTTHIAQSIQNESITKSLAADENVFWSVNKVEKKSSDFVLTNLGNGKYEVGSYKIIDLNSVKEIANKLGTDVSNIDVKMISKRATFEWAVLQNIKDSSKKNRVASFLSKISESDVTNDVDEDFALVMKYSISANDVSKYADVIKELSQYKKFSMTIK